MMVGAFWSIYYYQTCTKKELSLHQSAGKRGGRDTRRVERKKKIPRPRIKIHSNPLLCPLVDKEMQLVMVEPVEENMNSDLFMQIDHQPVYSTKHVLSGHVIASREKMQSHLLFYMIWYQPVNEVWRGTSQLKQ